MRIISKHKDYWHFLSHLRDFDGLVTYDIRDSVPITDDDIIRLVSKMKRWGGYLNPRGAKNTLDVVVEIGDVQYIFRSEDIINESCDENAVNWVGTWKRTLIVDHQQKIMRAPISIGPLYHMRDRMAFFRSDPTERWNGFDLFEYLNLNFDEGSEERYLIKDVIADPILSECFVSSLIPAEEIYKTLDVWMMSQKKDKNQDAHIDDVSKLEAAGFHKRESFRNVK